MDTFLEAYIQLSKTEPDRKRKSKQTSSKIEAVIKKLPASAGSDSVTGEFCQTFTEELMPIVLKLLQTISKKECFQTHSTKPALP